MAMTHHRPVRAVALWLALAACATTPSEPPPPPEPEGFLGDYSQLAHTAGRSERSSYFAPAARWGAYDAVWIDSVTLWANARRSMFTGEERQMLTDHLYAALDESLREDYRIVHGPGPGVIRVRAAISDEKGAPVELDAVTSDPPMLRIASTLGSLGKGRGQRNWLGKSALEADLRDAVSGERLAAVVDEEIRGISPRGGFATWNDVKRTFDAWAGDLRVLLAERRSGP